MLSVDKTVKPYLYCLFFMSGLSALIYETVWVRQLSLIFGSSHLSASILISTFMLGLALGSRFAGIWADRTKDLLRIYLYIHIGISLSAAVSPGFIWIIDKLFISLAGIYDVQWFLISISGIISFCFFIIPVFLIGATFPVMVKLFDTDHEYVGIRSAKLYSINTIGAITGVVLSSFIFMRYFGITQTLYIAVFVNAGIAAFAYFVLPGKLKFNDETYGWALPSNFIGTRTSGNSRLVKSGIFYIIFISGFSGLILQQVWIKLFLVILGSTIYSFAIVLMAYLLGLVIGSYLTVFYLKRSKTRNFHLSFISLMIAVLTLVTYSFFDNLGGITYVIVSLLNEVPAYAFFIQLLTTLVFMLPVTILLGSILPLGIHLYLDKNNGIGKRTGTIYMINSAGSALGALLGGIVLLRFFDLKEVLIMTCLLNMSAFLYLSYNRYRTRKILWLSYSFASILVIFILINTSNLNNGKLLNGFYYQQKRLSSGYEVEKVSGDELVFFKEGVNSIVSVHKKGDLLALKINGKADASNLKEDQQTMLLTGHLPSLFYPGEPRNALIIGIGSGITIGAALCHPFNEIDCVELEEAVYEASRFFHLENKNYFENPRVKVHIEDARNYVRKSKKKYDVIISEPSNLWIAGMANLFTTEHYQNCLALLSERGVFGQWIHYYSLKEEEFLTLVKTFSEVFPNVQCYKAGETDVLLIGSKEPLYFDIRMTVQKLHNRPYVLADLRKFGISEPWTLGVLYMTDREHLLLKSSRVTVMSDNNPYLEFTAPFSLFNRDMLAIKSMILDNAGPNKIIEQVRPYITDQVFGNFHLALARAFYHHQSFDRVIHHANEVLLRDPLNEMANEFAGSAQLAKGDYFSALYNFNRALKKNKNNHRVVYKNSLIYKKQNSHQLFIDMMKLLKPHVMLDQNYFNIYTEYVLSIGKIEEYTKLIEVGNSHFKMNKTVDMKKLSALINSK